MSEFLWRKHKSWGGLGIAEEKKVCLRHLQWVRGRHAIYPLFPTWEIRPKALSTQVGRRALPRRGSFFIITQPIWVLLVVLKVKLILDRKVKNPALLELGETEKKMFTFRDTEKSKQKMCYRTKVKGIERENDWTKLCKITLEGSTHFACELLK